MSSNNNGKDGSETTLSLLGQATKTRMRFASKTVQKINALARERTRRPKQKFKSWKEQYKHEAEKAQDMFMLDFERERQPLTWLHIYTILMNPQAKNHNKLVKSGQKSAVDFDMEDFFEGRKQNQLQQYKDMIHGKKDGAAEANPEVTQVNTEANTAKEAGTEKASDFD